MGEAFPRRKRRNWLNSIIYRLSKFIWINETARLKLFANLDFIFNRLAIESLNKIYADDESHPSREQLFQFIHNKIPKDAVVLDLGCGNGEISAMLGTLCKSVTGIDFDVSKVRHAIAVNSRDNVNFVCEDALLFLERNRVRYDVLICSHILEHLDDPISTLRMYKNYFSYIYIEVPDFEASYLNLARQRLNIPLNYTDDDHVYEYDRSEIQVLLTSLNMRIEAVDFRNSVMRYWISV